MSLWMADSPCIQSFSTSSMTSSRLGPACCSCASCCSPPAPSSPPFSPSPSPSAGMGIKPPSSVTVPRPPPPSAPLPAADPEPRQRRSTALRVSLCSACMSRWNSRCKAKTCNAEATCAASTRQLFTTSATASATGLLRLTFARACACRAGSASRSAACASGSEPGSDNASRFTGFTVIRIFFDLNSTSALHRPRTRKSTNSASAPFSSGLPARSRNRARPPAWHTGPPDRGAKMADLKAVSTCVSVHLAWHFDTARLAASSTFSPSQAEMAASCSNLDKSNPSWLVSIST
mmetsp:Transcript_61713/g.199989  ORF Transcript_61713/g.199989 Transcript_61713/m.199989 type:complete len:291 (-) Transcript_61713:1449-2321(-)